MLCNRSFRRFLKSRNILKNFGYSPSNACFTNDEPENINAVFLSERRFQYYNFYLVHVQLIL